MGDREPTAGELLRKAREGDVRTVEEAVEAGGRQAQEVERKVKEEESSGRIIIRAGGRTKRAVSKPSPPPPQPIINASTAIRLAAVKHVTALRVSLGAISISSLAPHAAYTTRVVDPPRSHSTDYTP